MTNSTFAILLGVHAGPPHFPTKYVHCRFDKAITARAHTHRHTHTHTPTHTHTHPALINDTISPSCSALLLPRPATPPLSPHPAKKLQPMAAKTGIQLPGGIVYDTRVLRIRFIVLNNRCLPQAADARTFRLETG